MFAIDSQSIRVLIKGCQLKYLLTYLILFFTIPGTIPAVPVEIGINYSGGRRSPDRFDRGLKNFRSSILPGEFSISQADEFRETEVRELWFRFSGFFGTNHFTGLELGEYRTPAIKIRELRSRGTLLDLNMQFKFSHFLFTYDYVGSLKRNWNWEMGGGFGFLTLARWRVKGLKVSPYDVSRYDSVHTARYGTIIRLRSGIIRKLSNHTLLRFGMRFSYLAFGDFIGTLNGLDAVWYHMQDGGLILLSPYDWIGGGIPLYDPLVGPTYISLLREKVLITAGLTEFYISAGFRF